MGGVADQQLQRLHKPPTLRQPGPIANFSRRVDVSPDYRCQMPSMALRCGCGQGIIFLPAPGHRRVMPRQPHRRKTSGYSPSPSGAHASFNAPARDSWRCRRTQAVPSHTTPLLLAAVSARLLHARQGNWSSYNATLSPFSCFQPRRLSKTSLSTCAVSSSRLRVGTSTCSLLSIGSPR